MAGVKRAVDLANARQLVGGRQVPVAGNMGGLADLRHGVGRVGRPIAVVGQPRVALQHERRVDQLATAGARPAPRRCPRRCGARGRTRASPSVPSVLGSRLDACSADEHIGRPAAPVHQEDRIVFALEQ